MSDRIIQAKAVISAEDRTGKAFDAIAKKFQQIGKGAKVSADVDRMMKSLARAESGLKAIDKFETKRPAFATARTNFRAAQAEVERLGKAMAAADKPTKQLEADFKRAQATVKAASAAYEKQSEAIKSARRAMEGSGVAFGKSVAEQERLRAAVDRTSAAIDRQLKMERQAASQARPMRAASTAARHAAEYDRHMRTHGIVGTATGAIGGAVAAHGALTTVEHVAKAGAEVQGTRVDMAKAGIPAAEIQAINDRGLELAIKYKNITQASVMELAKEVRSVMTSPEEMMHVLDPLAAAKSLLDAKDSTGEASHGLNMLIKGAENIGAAKDPERLTHLIDGYVKAMQVMGKTINPENIYEFDKYSKLGGARLSDRFLLTTSQSLSQEMSGSTAGKAVGQLYKQISGGMTNLHSAAQEFARIGLIDPANLDRTKTGEIKGVKKGVLHAVEGDTLAASDPDRWVYEKLLPRMEKAGMRSQDDQLAFVAKAFPNSGVADLIGKMIVQRETYEAHAKQYDSATGLKGAALNSEDAIASLNALSKSVETFAGVLSSPSMKTAAGVMDAIAGKIGAASGWLEGFNKEHPTVASAEFPAVAGAGAAGAGWLSYQVMTGFGLGRSAVALDGSAAALSEAAAALAGEGALPGKLPGGAAAAGLTVATLTVSGALIAAGGISLFAAGTTYPKMERDKPGSLDPATGAPRDTNPMEDLGRKPGEEPPLRRFWREHMPGWAGGGGRPPDLEGKALSAKVEQPIPIAATPLKVEFGTIENRVVVKVDGPGEVVNQSTTGTVARSAGTSMLSSGAIPGGP